MVNMRADGSLKRRINTSLGYGPARRADRKRRTSSPLRSRSGSPIRLAIQARSARHEFTHATIASVTTSPPNHSLTKCEFEFGRQSLRSAFQRCTDIDFMRVSVIISCLLHSFRALHILEVAAILVFLLGNESGGRTYDQGDDETTIRQLQAKCTQIFFIDPAGFVRFAHPLISKFLLSYPIRGIERSHAALAKACVTQLEFDGGIPDFNLAADVAPAAKKGRLSAYAAEHWDAHYRYEERRNASVTAQVHRLLWTEVARIGRCAGHGASETTIRRESLEQIRDYCVDRNFQVLGASYTRLIAEVRVQEAIGRSSYVSSEGQEEKVYLDQALSKLELTESDSDSDGWSLV